MSRHQDEVELRLLDQESQHTDDDALNTVRQIVPETDDPSLPSLTLRAVVLGSLFTVMGAAMSQLFFYKSNAPAFSTYFVILVSQPILRWLAHALPRRTIPIFGWNVQLNPGPVSIKEHVLLAVIVSSGATSAYASDIISIQELFFGQHMGTLPALTLLITTQVLGFGLAGLVHDILVRPPAMIYPSSLVTVSLFNTLHGQDSALSTSRMRFFATCFTAVLLYQFLPTVIWPTLSSIAILCLVYPSRITRVLGSGYHGFGIGNFSLDWNVLGASGPLFQPWWAALNFFSGIVGMMYVVMPMLYALNFWDIQRYPEALSSALFSSDFNLFDIDSILKPDNTLDEAAWAQKKPLLLTPFCES